MFGRGIGFVVLDRVATFRVDDMIIAIHIEKNAKEIGFSHFCFLEGLTMAVGLFVGYENFQNNVLFLWATGFQRL